MKNGLEIVPHNRHGKIELLNDVHNELFLSKFLRIDTKLNLLGIWIQKGFQDTKGQVFDMNSWNEVFAVSKDAKLFGVYDAFEELLEVFFSLTVDQAWHDEFALDQLVLLRDT